MVAVGDNGKEGLSLPQTTRRGSSGGSWNEAAKAAGRNAVKPQRRPSGVSIAVSPFPRSIVRHSSSLKHSSMARPVSTAMLSIYCPLYALDLSGNTSCIALCFFSYHLNKFTRSSTAVVLRSALFAGLTAALTHYSVVGVTLASLCISLFRFHLVVHFFFV